MAEMRNAYKISVCKAEGNRKLGRPRRKWEDNIKVDLKYNFRIPVSFGDLRWRVLINAILNTSVHNRRRLS
jgi:hypothetical protein